MFNRSYPSNKTLKGVEMAKNDTVPISLWDIPLALVLLTRLPVPKLPSQVFARQASAAWAFPLVGAILGALACCVGWAAMSIGLNATASALLVVTSLILSTGAMHEDGLADTVDGFWGGFTSERRLEIMKDSHIGTYGVLALILSLFLRVTLIETLIAAQYFSAILAATVWSRAMMPPVMASLPNARGSGLSQSVGAPKISIVAGGVGLAFGICAVLIGISALAAVLLSALAVLALAMVARSKIGGQTGDVLGATQQISEIAMLLTLVTLL